MVNELKTQKTYKATVKKFCTMFEIQNIEQLRSITSLHIIKFRDARKKLAKRTPASITACLGFLRFLNT